MRPSLALSLTLAIVTLLPLQVVYADGLLPAQTQAPQIAETATRTQGMSAVREQTNELAQQMHQPATVAQEKKQQIQQEQTADTASKATWGAFIVAVLSLSASAVGGLLGLKRRVYSSVTT